MNENKNNMQNEENNLNANPNPENENPTTEEDSAVEGFFKNIRTNFLYGLFITLPIIATVGLLFFLINFISVPLSAITSLPTWLSFILTIAIMTVIGFAAKNIIGRAILRFFENLMIRIPIISIIYKSSKQIVNAFNFKNKSLLSAVLVEYPRKGAHALAFITNETIHGLFDENGNDFGADKVALFVPTTPNPTSGYFIYVNKNDITRISLSVEDSIKVLMSAGVVSPE